MKASYLKMSPAAHYSFLYCPGHALLKAERSPCLHEWGSILWVTGTHFYLMKLYGIFSVLQDMGKISSCRTKRSKALPWHKDLNLTSRLGALMEQGGWLSLDQLVRLGLPAVALCRCPCCWWTSSSTLTVYILGIFLILNLQVSTTCFVFSKTTVKIHLCL